MTALKLNLDTQQHHSICPSDRHTELHIYDSTEAHLRHTKTSHYMSQWQTHRAAYIWQHWSSTLTHKNITICPSDRHIELHIYDSTEAPLYHIKTLLCMLLWYKLFLKWTVVKLWERSWGLGKGGGGGAARGEHLCSFLKGKCWYYKLTVLFS